MAKTMRQLIFVALLLGILSVNAQTLDWGDQGNGTYKNPVLNADYSDPDVIRVGLYCYGDGGKAQFDYFDYQITR